MLKVQKIAACDEIEVISRHMSDLKDYIYEPESSSLKNQDIEVKQLFM